jgi:hypothetical protein
MDGVTVECVSGPLEVDKESTEKHSWTFKAFSGLVEGPFSTISVSFSITESSLSRRNP